MTSSLQRRLTLPSALAVGVGSMVGAGVFTALGLAARMTSGSQAALLAALALAVAAATCNALSTAQLAAVHPASGGTYVYGRRQLSELAGFTAGWGFVTGKTASVAAMAMTVGLYVLPDSVWGARLVGASAVVLLTLLSLRGITRTVQATLAILVPVIAVLLLTVVASAAQGAPAAGSAVGPMTSGAPGVLGVLGAAGVLFFAFAGYARVATMGEEVVDPRRTIPRAVLGALAITVALYALLTWALLSSLGARGLARSADPVRQALDTALGSGWGVLAVIAAALACTGAMLNLLTGISRTALAMAREGDLPRPLARVSDGPGTPWVAQVAIAVVVIVLVLFTDILTIVGFSSFGVLVYYAVANLSAITLTPQERTVRAPKAVNFLGLLLCLALALTLPLVSVLTMLMVFGVGLLGRGIAVSRRLSRS